MRHTPAERTLAFAGIFQSAVLVDDVAFARRTDGDAVEASLASVLQIDAPSVSEVYGGPGRVQVGLRGLASYLLQRADPTRSPVPYYVAALVQVERRLRRSRKLVRRLADGVRASASQAEYFGASHENVLASLADLYRRTAGEVGPRIMVRGDPAQLENPHNANLVRALLLAGLRSTWMWRQCGGNRLGLLLGRRGMVREARQLAEQAHISLL
ncbi:MAG TPA: high frequency lysogenization protein HflD [Gammaproteobacteria bacterium]|nr:high frequency lysogenization protein HflD [Gammaproteobacteria bacterium]